MARRGKPPGLLDAGNVYQQLARPRSYSLYDDGKPKFSQPPKKDDDDEIRALIRHVHVTEISRRRGVGSSRTYIPEVVDPFTLKAGTGYFSVTGETMTVVSGYAMQADVGAFALTDPGTTKLTPPLAGPPVLTALGMINTGTSAQIQTAQFSSAAAAQRVVIISWTLPNGMDVASGTITPYASDGTTPAGTARNLTLVENRQDSGGCGIAYAVMASDADAAVKLTVTLNFNSSPFIQSVITMWTAPAAGFVSTAPTGHNHTTGATTTTQSTTVATSAGGFIVAAAYSETNASNTCTISGTETFATTNNSTVAGAQHGSANTSGAIAANAASTVTSSFAGTASGTALVAAAWR